MLVPLVLLAVLQTALAVRDKPSYNVDDFKEMGHHFEQFMKQYNRQYSGSEKADRFKVFIENVMEINELNHKHAGTTFDVNRFADMSKEEQHSFLGFSVDLGTDVIGDCVVLKGMNDKTAPAEWDWRAFDIVSEVKDQGTCLGCWAFSTTGMLESRSMQKGQYEVLSEQQLIDCDDKSHGCHGGLMTLGLTSIMKSGGIETEKDYPFVGVQNKNCSVNANKIAVKVANCSAYTVENEAALQDLLYKEGPLSIGVQANTWSYYRGGIMDDDRCLFDKMDHGVLLVGYGTENGEDYWVIKNSWNDQWGENGYIRIKRNIGCCGIGQGEAYAIVSAALQ